MLPADFKEKDGNCLKEDYHDSQISLGREPVIHDPHCHGINLHQNQRCKRIGKNRYYPASHTVIPVSFIHDPHRCTHTKKRRQNRKYLVGGHCSHQYQLQHIAIPHNDHTDAENIDNIFYNPGKGIIDLPVYVIQRVDTARNQIQGKWQNDHHPTAIQIKEFLCRAIQKEHHKGKHKIDQKYRKHIGKYTAHIFRERNPRFLMTEINRERNKYKRISCHNSPGLFHHVGINSFMKDQIGNCPRQNPRQ